METDYEFSVGDKLLAYYGQVLYEAKCLKRRKTDTGDIEYYIHYKGFNTNWDEWVYDDEVLEINEINLGHKERLEARVNELKRSKKQKGSTKKQKIEDTKTKVISSSSNEEPKKRGRPRKIIPQTNTIHHEIVDQTKTINKYTDPECTPSSSTIRGSTETLKKVKTHTNKNKKPSNEVIINAKKNKIEPNKNQLTDIDYNNKSQQEFKTVEICHKTYTNNKTTKVLQVNDSYTSVQAIGPVLKETVTPVIEKAKEPAVEEQTMKEVTGPAVEEAVISAIEEEKRQVVEKAKEPAGEQAIEKVTEPVVEQVVIPAIEVEKGQAIEKVIEPAVEKVVIPAIEVEKGQAIEKVTEPAVEQVVIPAIEVEKGQAIEKVTEPAVKQLLVSAVEQVVIPAIEEEIEQTIEKVIEQAVKQPLVQAVEQVVIPALKEEKGRAVEEAKDLVIEKVEEQDTDIPVNNTSKLIVDKSNEPTVENTTEEVVENITNNTEEDDDDDAIQAVANIVLKIIPCSLVLANELRCLKLPPNLQKAFASDFMMHNKYLKLIRFPEDYFMAEILHAFTLSNFFKNTNQKLDSKMFCVTLMQYFNLSIHKQLIYAIEKRYCVQNRGMKYFQQRQKDQPSLTYIYNQHLKPKKVWCYVYGPAYLLRLLVNLPKIITSNAWCPACEISTFIYFIRRLLQFLEFNSNIFFNSSDYMFM